MIIRKWMKKCLIFSLVFLPRALQGEVNQGLRLHPAYYLPIGDNLLKGSFGGSGLFEVTFGKHFGVFAQGEAVSVTLENLEPMLLMDGSLGVTGIARLNDRVSVQADLMAGIYSVRRKEDSISGISAGARAAVNFHVTPAVTAGVFTSFRHYAFTPKPFMNAVALGSVVSLNLSQALGNRTRVSMNVLAQDSVFPVFYSWYDENSFSKIEITNNEDTVITDVVTYFYLEQYMGQPTQCSFTGNIPRGGTAEIDIEAFFNESMLDLTERIDARAKIIVEYRSLGAKKRAEFPLDIPVYHRNAMSWADDRRAAAFVSSRDPAALWFSKYVNAIVQDRMRTGVNKNMQYAAGAFEALNVFGLNYVVDPTSAYANNTGTDSIDFLQFPYQTLTYRGGDCDDLSILFCSLMEAVGIETAFITIPGHIYMAFDSGLTEQEARDNFYSSDQLIFANGKVWVPLEVTLTKEGFTKAWRIGAKQWNDSAARGTAQLYPMKDSWTVYRPVSIPGAGSRFNLPETSLVASAFDKSVDSLVEREIRPQILEYRNRLTARNSMEDRNALGVLYGRYGLFTEAEKEFLLVSGGMDVHSLNNRGNIYFMRGEYEKAEALYARALKIDPVNNIALAGSARCWYELGDFARSDSLYARLARHDPALARTYGYLASFYETKGRAWSLADRLNTTYWSVPVVVKKEDEPTEATVDDEQFEGEPEGLLSMISIGETVLVDTKVPPAPAAPEPAPAEPVVTLAEPAPEPAPAEPAPVTAEPVVALAEPEPVAAEPVPALAESVPAPAEPVVTLAESVPVPAEPVPVLAEPVVALAVPEPVVAEPVPVPAEPVVALVEPEVALAEPEPAPAEAVAAPAEPVAALAESVPVPAEPVAVPAEPVVALEPVVAEPVPVPAEPEVALAEPVPVPAEPVVALVEPEVALAEPEPAPAEPVVALVEPVPVLAEPVAALAEPEPVVAEPVPVPAEPVVALVEPSEPAPSERAPVSDKPVLAAVATTPLEQKTEAPAKSEESAPAPLALASMPSPSVMPSVSNNVEQSEGRGKPLILLIIVSISAGVAAAGVSLIHRFRKGRSAKVRK